MLHDDLETADDVFWMLLTLMTLSADEQLRHLPYVPTRSQTSLVESSATNPLISLLRGLQISGWQDVFDVETPALDAFNSAVDRLAVMTNLHLFCREEFVHGEAWTELRALARSALAESGMPPHSIPERINFREFLEFHDYE